MTLTHTFSQTRKENDQKVKRLVHFKDAKAVEGKAVFHSCSLSLNVPRVLAASY